MKIHVKFPLMVVLAFVVLFSGCIVQYSSEKSAKESTSTVSAGAIGKEETTTQTVEDAIVAQNQSDEIDLKELEGGGVEAPEILVPDFEGNQTIEDDYFESPV